MTHPIVDDHPAVKKFRAEQAKLDQERDDALDQAHKDVAAYQERLRTAGVGEALPPRPVDTREVYDHHRAKTAAVTFAQNEAIAADADRLLGQIDDRAETVLNEVRSHLEAIDDLAGEFKELLKAHVMVRKVASGITGVLVSKANTSMGVVMAAARQGWNPIHDRDIPEVNLPLYIDRGPERPRDAA